MLHRFNLLTRVNSQQAKEILLLYRPGVPEPDDPELAAALELAKNDPELRRWLELHQTTQQVLRAKFRELPVPEGLKEQILSERKAYVSMPLRRKAALAMLSVFSALLLIGILFAFLRPREDKSFANFRNRMVRTVARQYPKMDLETSDVTQIRSYLSQHQALGNYELPAALQQTVPTGCAILQWQGKPVSMVCFKSAPNLPANAADLFLFIIKRTDVPNAPAAPEPQFAQSNSLATASWSDKDKTYVLAGFGNESFLRRFF